MAHPEQHGTGEFPVVDLAGGDPLQQVFPAPAVLAGGRPVGLLPAARLAPQLDFLPALRLALLQAAPGAVRPAPRLVLRDRTQAEGGDMRR